MNRFFPWFVVLSALAVVSCDASRENLLAPGTETPAILDARNTELAGSGVYLLPPINDNQYTRTGPFDVGADPRLEICRLDVQGDMTVANIEAAACETVVAWFETDVSHDGATFIQVTPGPGDPATSDSLFSVGWKTDAADAGSAFRGSILVPSLAVAGDGTMSVVYDTAARFDALLYENSSNKLDPDFIVGTTAGQNFPIKFIVEESAGCDGLDCFAYRVTCETETYQTAHAGVLMPEDWAPECDVSVPGPERTWWLFQERLPAGTPCIPSPLIDGIQYEPCYVWQLAEEIDTGEATQFALYQEEFARPVTVQFCYNDEADGGPPDALVPLTAVYRYSTLPGGGSEVALNPEAEANALSEFTCPYDGPGAGSGPLAALTGLVRPALRALGLEPRPLVAGDRGTLSTKTVRMSDFQHVLHFDVTFPGEAIGALLVGSSRDIGIRLVTPPHGEPLDGPAAGVPGIEVQYRVIGDADLSGGVPCTDSSGATIDDCVIVVTSLDDPSTPGDEAGDATATLIVGSTGGTVLIEISVPADPDADPLVLSVETVDLEVVFLEPLDKTGDFYGLPDERFEPTVLICDAAAFPCDANTAEAVIPTSAIKLVEETGGRKFYQTDWKPRDSGTATGGTYFAQVLVEGATVGQSIPIVTTKGGKSERIEDVYYNGVNSSLALKFTITPAGG